MLREIADFLWFRKIKEKHLTHATKAKHKQQQKNVPRNYELHFRVQGKKSVILKTSQHTNVQRLHQEFMISSSFLQI